MHSVSRLVKRIELIAFDSRPVDEVDIAHLDSSSVKQLLQTWESHVGSSWVAVWPWNREAIEVAARDFIQHYDDLWYPSSDDVWITNDRTDWLIELNHEEMARLWKSG